MSFGMPDHPGYAPKEYFYRPQATDLKKFNERFEAIDWSKKRKTPTPAERRAADDTRFVEKEIND